MSAFSLKLRLTLASTSAVCMAFLYFREKMRREKLEAVHKKGNIIVVLKATASSDEPLIKFRKQLDLESFGEKDDILSFSELKVHTSAICTPVLKLVFTLKSRDEATLLVSCLQKYCATTGSDVRSSVMTHTLNMSIV